MSLSSLKGKIIAFDTETTGLNPWDSRVFKKYNMHPARPFAFSLCDTLGNTAYLRWEVDPKTRRVLPNRKDRKDLTDLLSDPSMTKVGHNLSFDIRMSRRVGIGFDWKKIHDTQFMAHVFTGGSLLSYGLKPLSKMWLEIEEDDQKDLMDSVKKARHKAKKLGWAIANKETHGQHYIKSDYWLGDPELCKRYAVQDAERTMLLYLGLCEEFDDKAWSVYNREIALSKAIYRMEEAGVAVNFYALKRLRKFYSEYADKWLKIACKNGGKGMNFNSPKQMVQKFCIEEGHTTRNRTKGGKPQINNAELKRMAAKSKLAKAILEYKAGEAMVSKFIAPYERFMVKEGWHHVLHPNFRQCGPVTGRLSCSDPNLQQAAAEDSAKKQADIGLKPREAMGPRKGRVWYLPDFSQMEVWVFAFQAKDSTMTKALLTGEDFHTATAARVWGDEDDWEENKGLYRKKGKTMMFLKQYGGTSKAASELLDCSRAEAQDAIDRYDDRLPGVNEFVRKMSDLAERQGHIENPFGRKYSIDPDFSYKAVNYLVQGTCADIMKNAIIRIDILLRKKWKGAKILMTLHDELIIEVPRSLHLRELRRDIIREMQRDSEKVGLPVPLPVTMKWTQTTWSQAKEL